MPTGKKMKKRSRKIAVLRISPELLMFRPGKFEVVGNALPKDAKFRGASFNFMTNEFEVGVESKQFKSVKEGVIAPYLEPPMIKKEIKP